MYQSARPILLIEDDLPLSESLSQFLEDHGYQVISATTLKEGWDLLRSKSPKLCLLDLNLPDGNGLELVRRMAQEDVDTKVVVMTAFDVMHLRPRNARMLAAWLTKPVNPLELLKIVERTMGEPTATAAGAP